MKKEIEHIGLEAYKRPILDYLGEGKSVFICLYPFYKKVFDDYYNWEANLEKTFDLLETITWNEVSKNIGFDNLNYVAQGILHLKEPYSSEIKDYCDSNRIDTPNYEDDFFPEVLLIPILRYLKSINHKLVKTKQILRFPESLQQTLNLDEVDMFSAYYTLLGSKHIVTESNINLVIPDYDCPYMLLSGSEDECTRLINSAKLEVIRVENKTRFDWWDE